jgi:putative nucleotidyltransferase with HDIG domain
MLTEKQKKIIGKIHNYVKKECIGFVGDKLFKGGDNVFKNHILEVKNYSASLAKQYKADEFVVIVAAYLHDISYIQTRNHENHEIKGSEFARKFLKNYNISEKEINLISKCIQRHRGSKEEKRESIEEKIVACADAMDHINRFQDMFYRVGQNNSYEDTVKWVKSKMERGWKKLELKKARQIVKKKYDAAMISLA